jgi:hypothetical protein
MTTVCPACWRVVPNEARRCSECGGDVSHFHEEALRDTLLAGLSETDRDAATRAAVALAARHDVAASQAIEATMQRFPDEPYVLVSLLEALMLVAEGDARRIALDALGNPSFIVRRAAAEILEQIGRCNAESACARREP